MLKGQFISSIFLELDCCGADLEEDRTLDPEDQLCFNIPTTNEPCHSFTRSDWICSESAVREQINMLTAFVDGSQIYGSDNDTSRRLRLFQSGLLKTNDDSSFSVENLPTRRQCGFSTRPDWLFTGDVRSSTQPTLTAIHTLFLNEHNRIAKGLKEQLIQFDSFQSLSSREQDELLFQEARKIVGAELQKIVYKDYLPIILGETAMNENGLNVGEQTEYDADVDSSIFNEFATVGYRFGHSLVAEVFVGRFPWPLNRHFFDSSSVPDVFVTGENGKNWMREMTGSSGQACPKQDLIAADAMRNHFDVGDEDIIARNIQRGRDHGIPSYSKLREICGLASIKGSDRPEEINESTWNKIVTTYNGNIDDIDPYTGGLAEMAPNDALVGPLFACIIGRQFKSLMVGDRFFYLHHADSDQKAVGLKANTKRMVMGRSLADIICDNTDTDKIHANVFRVKSESNREVSCETIENINFKDVAEEIIEKDDEPPPCVCSDSAGKHRKTV